jgi:UDP-N-acetylglucosamine 1-carboxyvinyltransferase
LVGAAVTGGEVKIINFPLNDLEIPMAYLREAGLNYYLSADRNEIIIKDSNIYPLEVATLPYPGINSDVQPILAVWALNAKAKSKIIDLRFPERYQYTEELKKIGGKFEVDDKGMLVITPTKLEGSKTRATDLRGGAALVLAGLVAEGVTTVSNFEEVQRGYPEIINKLQGLGGEIELV